MYDKYGLESHKLAWHPKRVAAWLRGENISPLFLEICPAGTCQHRCIYCAFDYQKYRGPLISETFCKIMLEQAAEIGVKAVCFAGEGEPLMHPSVIELISYSKMHGLDVAMSTNGVLFDERRALNALPFLDWIRFSLDAASSDTYSKIHRCKPSDFDKVVANIRRAVEIKKERRCECTIGIQALLLPQNEAEMVVIAQMAKGLGVDYFTIKPFSKHPSSICDINFDYQASTHYGSSLSSLLQEVEAFSDDSFQVLVRAHTMEKLNEPRPYKQCLGLPFSTYIDAGGDVYACSAFLGNRDFTYGNIYNECFPAIWEGERRQLVLKMVAEIGVDRCREVCHLDEINRYLWHLSKEPPLHVNFI